MGSWYLNCADNDNVVSTRIRFARNLNGIPFPKGMTEEMKNDLKGKVKSVINNSSYPIAKSLKYIDMADVPENEIMAMVERHIISPEFARTREGRAIVLSDDESISVMICEEDHLRIQVILAGLNLTKAYSIAEQLDSMFNEKLHFAFDKDLGYLTECPTNLGTGMRASVMLHLPLLEKSGQLATLSETVNKIGFAVRGLYGEGSKSGASLYQISNQITLGIDEKTAIDNLTLITSQIIEKEKNAGEGIDRIALEDKVYRAYGILSNCRILTSKEMMDLISLIKLGCEMGIIKETVSVIKLFIETSPYMLMKKYGNLTPEERDIKRAEYIRENLKV